MNKDYKFLADGQDRARPRMRASRRHLMALGVVGGVLTAVLTMTPYQAEATRKAEAVPVGLVTQALALPTPATQRSLRRDAAADVDAALDRVEAREGDLDTGAAELAGVQPAPVPVVGEWLEVTVKRGDSLARIFSRNSLSASELHEIMQLGKEVKRLRNVHPGEVLRIRVLDGKVQELQLKIDRARSLRVERSGKSFIAQSVEREYERRLTQASGVIEESLFLAGQKSGISDRLTMELASLFGWDVDFALDIRTGDQFSLIYEELYLDGEKVRDGDVLAAEFINQGKSHRVIRYQTKNDDTSYYDPDGRSVRKAFLRTPVKFSRISSRFNLRRKHPILNRIRAHKGVDYAAPRGTPVRATGNGKIIHRGRKGGYGKTVILRHANRYTTLYAHLSRYKKGLGVGSRVKQGEIIGYIGSTGLATGPHLHYEFRIAGVHRNPLTVKLPTAEPLAKQHRPQFERHARPLLAQLDQLKVNLVASNP